MPLSKTRNREHARDGMRALRAKREGMLQPKPDMLQPKRGAEWWVQALADLGVDCVVESVIPKLQPKLPFYAGNHFGEVRNKGYAKQFFESLCAT